MWEEGQRSRNWDPNSELRMERLDTDTTASSHPLDTPAIFVAPRWHLSPRVHLCVLIWLGATPLVSLVSCGKDSHWALTTCLPLSCFILTKTEIASLARLTTTYACNVVSKGTAQVSLNALEFDGEKASCWTLMLTVGLLDPPSSGRIVQVHTGSNSPHLGEGLHLPPQFDSYSLLLLKADNTVNAQYPVLLWSHGMPWWEYHSYFLGT